MFVQLFVAVDAKAKTTLSTSHDSHIPSICMVYVPTFGCSLPVNVGKTYHTYGCYGSYIASASKQLLEANANHWKSILLFDFPTHQSS